MNCKVPLFIIHIVLLTFIVGCQQKDDNQYEAFITIGKAALEEGRYDDAIISFKQALEKKTNDEDALEFLLLAQEEKVKEELSKQTIVDNVLPEKEKKEEELGLKIVKQNDNFYLNNLTLLMTKDEIINLWGEPTVIERPNPDDDYYRDDYTEWLFLKYGGITLTLYSGFLRIVEIDTDDFVFSQEWYKELGDPDIVKENHYSFFTTEQFLNFSGNEPHIQWGEIKPKTIAEIIGSDYLVSNSENEYHLSTQSIDEYFDRINQATGYNIALEDLEPIKNYKNPMEIIGYNYQITDSLNISYTENEIIENIGVTQWGGREISSETLWVFESAIESASPIDSQRIIHTLLNSLRKSENGLYSYSLIYENGLVYEYVENALSFSLNIYVEGYEEIR